MDRGAAGESHECVPLQASIKPFKLSHETWLDSVAICILMAIFAADMAADAQKDLSDHNTFLSIVFFAGVLVLIVCAGLAKWYTRKEIRSVHTLRDDPLGLYPIVTLKKHLLNMIGNLG